MDLPSPPESLIKRSTKLPWVEDQKAPPPRVDLDAEYKSMEQKIPSKIQKTPPSAAKREKYNKKLKELV